MSFGSQTRSREDVFGYLFGLLAGIQWNEGTDIAPVMKGFVTKTREIKLFSDVPAAQQPWVGQAEHSDGSQQKSNLPYKRTWEATWIIYHKGPSPRSRYNNLIIDAVEAALAPQPGDEGFFDKRNTLFGRVWHCFIDGAIFKDPGDLDNQALITVPIKLLVP